MPRTPLGSQEAATRATVSRGRGGLTVRVSGPAIS
ncbi:hypothetical protein SALBM135S_08399 [Streptomyces alboniger]